MNYYIDSSKIHGRGIHANKNFQPGDDIGHLIFAVKEDSANKEYFKTKLSEFLGTKIERSDLEKYLNHTSNPNAECKTIGNEVRLLATKLIKKDEEIAVDYTHAFRELDKAQLIASR